ncbi:large conductance mechanosensitive channel protein MscL [Mycoplasmopsis arginini]|uniref:large conductance mechanosensitive channel protein MscL n=1 Tax=Mycoplasmopsis arginini TaxID=2094 RepID=UPI000A27CA13|nr:MscL family protein [Mycoplasmopsis arginini]SGA02445.1 Large-conductance mechanosensitive channel [Chlamydia abortus]MDI3351570.1 MscL family protein [Mycoplasmopsis arginini]MDI3352104.1 MscL family protein [Mycoplasmopsis arginini]PWC08817.1 mechanosensitive ion channel protein MscL [Mycoplasmopsis arginini]SGA13328.1 Large-conductance mechanosensitive channel [Mycoplasmopsis arginini]
MTKKELEEKRKYFKKSFKDANSVLKRGNIFMLAIGLLLGASFGAVVSSLAKDIIMAAITSLFDVQEVKQIKVGNILLGEFLAALIQFIIVSAFIFITLFVFYLIKNSIEYHKAKKLLIEEEKEEKVVLTTEELILEELKKINKELSKNNQEN